MNKTASKLENTLLGEKRGVYIPYRYLSNEMLTLVEKVFLGAIFTATNRVTGKCALTLKELSQLCSCSIPSARKRVLDLQEKEFVYSSHPEIALFLSRQELVDEYKAAKKEIQ